MKLKFWCDSGANIHSCREQVVDLEKYGITDEEWDAMDEDGQMEVVREWAYDRLEMGWKPLD